MEIIITHLYILKYLSNYSSDFIISLKKEIIVSTFVICFLTIVVVSVLYEEQIIPIKHESIFCKFS